VPIRRTARSTSPICWRCWRNGAAPGGCDINGDGVVDVTDLLALLAAWGICP
jgi:hypothetical protein